MADTGGATTTLTATSAALLKDSRSLLEYVRECIQGGEPPKSEVTPERPHIANPIDDAISMIQEAQKCMEETRAVLGSAVFSKLR